MRPIVSDDEYRKLQQTLIANGLGTRWTVGWLLPADGVGGPTSGVNSRSMVYSTGLAKVLPTRIQRAGRPDLARRLPTTRAAPIS
jgi:hypothetical protein